MITILYQKHQLNCLNFSSVAVVDLQFSAVLMTTVKFYKMIFRFNLFNLPVYHFRKLISPLSIGFIRMELRLQYVYTDVLSYFCKWTIVY